MASTQHTKEDVQLSQDRRDAILNFILEYFTGDQIDRKALGHFAFVAEMFGLTAKVKDMVGKTSSIQGRQELCISLALAALNLAVSDEPVEVTERQLERRERREATKQFEATVVAVKGPAAGKSKSKPSAQDALDRIRQKNRDRQRERRARLKASRTVYDAFS